MNLRDLSYLEALITHRHFGKAAKACFVSQPALSMQIKKLETALGITLIERSNKQVLITPIGEQIGLHARKILQLIDEMHTLAQATNDPHRGTLTLGIIPTCAPYLLPHIMPMLTTAFPLLKLHLIEERTNDLTTKLLAGDIDTAILALPVAQDQLKSIPLYNEAFLLAASKTHPLAKRKSVRQQDLANQSLLLLAEGHCLREQALSFCQKNSTPDVATFQATSLETLRHMVASGNGITLMPSLAQQTKDHLAYIPFQTPKPARTMGLCWRGSSVKNALLTDISLLIRQKMGTIETE